MTLHLWLPIILRHIFLTSIYAQRSLANLAYTIFEVHSDWFYLAPLLYELRAFEAAFPVTVVGIVPIYNVALRFRFHKFLHFLCFYLYIFIILDKKYLLIAEYLLISTMTSTWSSLSSLTISGSADRKIIIAVDFVSIN